MATLDSPGQAFSSNEVLEHIPDALLVLDRDWRILFVNAAAERLAGKDRREGLGRSVWEVFPQLLGTTTYHQCRKAMTEQVPVEYETFSVVLEGWVEVRAFPTPQTLTVFIRDIARRKRAEEGLARYELLVRHSRDIILFVRRCDGRIIEVNAAAVKAYGYTLEELLSRTIHDLRASATRSAIELDMSVADESGIAFETVHCRKDGSTFPVEVSSQGAAGTDGRILLSIIRDISDRRQAEESLRTSEERYRFLTEFIPQIVWSTDAEGRFFDCNERCVEYMGLPYAEIRRGGWLCCVHPEDLPHASGRWHRALAAGEKYEAELRLRCASDGLYRWHLDQAVPMKDQDGRIVRWFGTSTDIHEQKITQEALRDSRDKLALAIDAVQMGIGEWNMLTGQFRWNARHYELFGYAPNSFCPTYESWRSRIHPGDLERLEREFQQCAGERKDYASEYRVIWPTGEVRYLKGVARFEYGADGKPVTAIGVVFDVTALKQAEIAMRQAKEEAEAAGEAKDQFLAVLSHELRTPLTPVLAMAQLMEVDPALPADLREPVKIIRRNVELEAKLIDDLLDLTSISRGKLELHFTTADLHEKLQHVIQICGSDIRSRQLSLTVELDAVCHHVLADAARLQQILWNLLKNAVKFTPPGGRIAVRTRNGEAGQVSVVISDSGIGIEPHLLPRLFTAFEQGGKDVTRQFGGLGLGLAISKQLVDLHGGILTAQSDGRGRGATFTLALRTSSEGSSVGSLGSNAGPLTATGNGRLLLVEDHADTARTMSLLLKGYGFDVRVAHSVASAVRMAQAEAFDLLISDIGLPDGSGLDLMRQLRLQYPIRGIAVSGYGMEEDVRRSMDAGFMAHLTKPINMQKLEAVIGQVYG